MKTIILPTETENTSIAKALKDLETATKAVASIAKKQILAIVRQIIPDGVRLNTYGLLNDMSLENVYKYDTPRDYPCNFVIVGVTVNQGKLEFSAVDTDDEDGEWTFDETAWTFDETAMNASEWNSLLEYFSGVAELLNDGDAVIETSVKTNEVFVVTNED